MKKKKNILIQVSKITKFKVQIISNENNRNQFIENNKIYQTNFTRKNNRLKNNEEKKENTAQKTIFLKL